MEPTEHTAARADPRRFDARSGVRRRAMALSLAAAVLLLAGKAGAYALTGSTAILSDAAESVVHLFATVVAAFSLWYAAAPADTEHLYGHGKIAYFSAGFEGGMILLAGLGILYASGRALVYGPELQELGVGLAIIAGAAALNLGLGRYLVHVGRRTRSLVLVANGQDVLMDVWTSVGVLAGVALVWLTGLAWLDPVVATLAALHILWTGTRLMRRAFAGLMERADPEATQALLDELERARREGLVAGFHQVRHRRVGDTVWIECHLLFPDGLSITEAHDRSHAVEAAVQQLFPEDEVHVTAHLEPATHEAAHPEDHAEPADPLRPLQSEGR